MSQNPSDIIVALTPNAILGPNNTILNPGTIIDPNNAATSSNNTILSPNIISPEITSNIDLYNTSVQPSSLKFLQYNIDAALTSEKVEQTKFSNRVARIKALILETDADVVNLQELRKLPNTITPMQFLASFEENGYNFIMSARNASDLAFHQAILYKSNRLFCLENKIQWLSDSPDLPSDTWSLSYNNGVREYGVKGFAAIVMCAKFMSIVNGKFSNINPFWIFNTHFPLDEDSKNDACHTINQIIAKLAGNEHYILSGDFNFFPDKNEKAQASILEKYMIDVGYGALTLGGRKINGTFIGHEHDTFKADLNNPISRLDRVYVDKNTNITNYNSVLYTKTMLPGESIADELTHRNYPSDHLPILSEFFYN